MTEEAPQKWWLTWGLEIIRLDTPPAVFDEPSINVFRIPFGSAREADTVKAEIQRYLGGVLLRAVENGFKIDPADRADIEETPDNAD